MRALISMRPLSSLSPSVCLTLPPPLPQVVSTQLQRRALLCNNNASRPWPTSPTSFVSLPFTSPQPRSTRALIKFWYSRWVRSRIRDQWPRLSNTLKPLAIQCPSTRTQLAEFMLDLVNSEFTDEQTVRTILVLYDKTKTAEEEVVEAELPPTTFEPDTVNQSVCDSVQTARLPDMEGPDSVCGPCDHVSDRHHLFLLCLHRCEAP